MSIDRYLIIRQLGNDKYGSTYLAESTLMPSRSYCVIKKLKIEHVDQSFQSDIRKRFFKELFILDDLGKEGNGGIPQVYDFFTEEDELYLVQEYIDGQTLFDSVKIHGLFNEARVRQLLIDVLLILKFIHDRQLIHKGVSPKSIILRERTSKPVLIDFGITKYIEMETSIKSISFSDSQFISKEQIMGRSVCASDIYSLGFTAIYLLTGKMPNELFTNSPNGIRCQDFAPYLSSQLADILNTAISFSLHDRYKDANEMLKALKLITEVDNRTKSEPLAKGFTMKMEQRITNSVKERNPQQSQFWDKADRMAIMIAGGIALGSAIAQLPGAIAGGVLAAGYAWYIRLI
jgi:serine/threonine protein kinase, bacterial